MTLCLCGVRPPWPGIHPNLFGHQKAGIPALSTHRGLRDSAGRILCSLIRAEYTYMVSPPTQFQIQARTQNIWHSLWLLESLNTLLLEVPPVPDRSQTFTSSAAWQPGHRHDPGPCWQLRT